MFVYLGLTHCYVQKLLYLALQDKTTIYSYSKPLQTTQGLHAREYGSLAQPLFNQQLFLCEQHVKKKIKIDILDKALI